MNPSEQGYVSWSRISRAAEDRRERLAVGVELDAAVDDDLQRRPDLGDRRLAAQLEHALEEDEQPARHAADQGDRLAAGSARPGVASLRSQFGFQGQLERREGVGAEQRSISSCAAIPLRSPWRTPGAGCSRSVDPPRKKSRPWNSRESGRAGQVVGHHRLRGLAVRREHLARDRDVLGRPLRRAAGQGQVRDPARARSGCRRPGTGRGDSASRGPHTSGAGPPAGSRRPSGSTRSRGRGRTGSSRGLRTAERGSAPGPRTGSASASRATSVGLAYAGGSPVDRARTGGAASRRAGSNGDVWPDLIVRVQGPSTPRQK